MSTLAQSRAVSRGRRVDAPLLIIVALALGGSIYLALRPATLMLHALGGLGFSPSLASLRESAGRVRDACPPWVLYSLPDALWMFAAALTVRWYWAGAGNAGRDPARRWAAVLLAIGFSSELAQLAGVLRGTFDLLDLMAYAAGFAAAFIPRFDRSPS